jgi:hypothetical protein
MSTKTKVKYLTNNNYEQQHKSFTNRTADWTYQRKYKKTRKSYEIIQNPTKLEGLRFKYKHKD